MSFSFLEELGPTAVSHRGELEEVKQQLDIRRNELDCWIYAFLENKKFDIDETIAKLQRRFSMEVEEMARYEFTDSMRESLQSGVIQVIGEDKLGRTVIYITVSRDTNTRTSREDKKRTFDLLVSYGTRLRADSKRCQMVLLVNYENASVLSNVDLSLQVRIARRVSRFFPGSIAKILMCNMSSMVCMVVKPVLEQVPATLSGSIALYSSADVNNGSLLEHIDASVLPVALGGGNDCDDQVHWHRQAEMIEDYFHGMRAAICERGLTLKEWELESLTHEGTMA